MLTIHRNQQFTSTNLTINNACTAVYLNWDWLWSFKDLKINNCQIGIDMPLRDKPAIGHAILSDSVFNNVEQGIVTTFNCSGANKPASIGSLILQNVDMTTTNIAISYPNKTVILPGHIHVDYWMQGNTYSAYYSQQTFPDYDNQTCWIPKAPRICVQGSFQPPPIPDSLKATGTQSIFDRGKPQYDGWPLSAFISTKANGCVGDGKADDTDCLINIFDRVTEDQIVYIDHGGYRVTKPIQIPSNIKIVGEFWPIIFINDVNGFWSDKNNPRPAIRVGNPGDKGHLEIQDVLFETMGPTPGAILLEWNLAEDAKGSAGMWDVHWRLGGTAGTQLQELWDDGTKHCAKDPNILITVPDPSCYVSFLAVHITSTAELYMENNWVWVSDHEMDQQTHGQINIWNGRGLLIESQTALWVVGGSIEHSMLYNYGLHNAKNVYLSHIQSETA
jgi:glucan 1,3-beta-glucosidase